MKKIFLTVISLILFQTCAMAFNSNIKFIQVTDVHFSKDKPYTVQVLKNTVKDINRQKGVSFVVFTGDNLGGPNPEDLGDFIDIVNKIRVPYYIQIGNHDVFKSKNLSKARYNEIVREHNIFWVHRKWNYVFKKKGYVFIVVDGAKEVIPGPVGYYRDDTLTWLDKQLRKYKRRPVIILQHYPIIDPSEYGAGLKSHRTYQPEKYFKVLDKYNNVLAIVTGHLHMNGEVMKNGVYHITTPSLIAEPNTYKIIDIVSKSGLSPIIYTQLKEVEAD